VKIKNKSLHESIPKRYRNWWINETKSFKRPDRSSGLRRNSFVRRRNTVSPTGACRNLGWKNRMSGCCGKKWISFLVFKTVDTCAAGVCCVDTVSLFYVWTWKWIDKGKKKKIVILGGGPNRIGQVSKFHYSVCMEWWPCGKTITKWSWSIVIRKTVRGLRYDGQIVLWTLTLEDVLNICDHEQPTASLLSFGGQTPLKIAKRLKRTRSHSGNIPGGNRHRGRPWTVRAAAAKIEY